MSTIVGKAVSTTGTPSSSGGLLMMALVAVGAAIGFGPDVLELLDGLEMLDTLEMLDLGVFDRLRPPLRTDVVVGTLTGSALILSLRAAHLQLRDPGRRTVSPRAIRSAWAEALAVQQTASRTVTHERSTEAMAPAKHRQASWIKRSIRSPGPAVCWSLCPDPTRRVSEVDALDRWGKVDVLPEFSPRTVEIQTEAALGLSTEDIEQFITAPREQLSGAALADHDHLDAAQPVRRSLSVPPLAQEQGSPRVGWGRDRARDVVGSQP